MKAITLALVRICSLQRRARFSGTNVAGNQVPRLLLALLLFSGSCLAQGTVNFNTRVPGLLDAPVTLLATGEGPGPAYTAELVLVGPGGSITPIPQSLTTFRPIPTAGISSPMKYVVPVPVVEIPGTTVGSSAILRFRAFLTSAGSFNAANAYQKGQSSDLTVPVLGGPNNPANLVGITGFILPPIPEPSTIALFGLAACAFVLLNKSGRSLFLALLTTASPTFAEGDELWR
jgi:hypothetical protein